MAAESKVDVTNATGRSASKRRLVTQRTISDNPSEVFVVKFSDDGKLLAAGCADGSIRVFNLKTQYTHVLNVGKTDNLPVTALRFRPTTAASKTKNVLLVVNADGSAQHWHATSGMCLHTISDPDNQLYCVDYKSDGSIFATAGKDKMVRIYDEATKSLVSTLSGGIPHVTAGHSNRVFSLKFYPGDENLLVSGGWDNTVQIWDLRVGHSVRSIYGPHICGDAVDVSHDIILTGSWRPDKPLELWDFNTGKLIETVEWNQSGLRGESCMLYAAQFSKDPAASLIAAGGSNSNMAKVFDRTNGNRLIGTVAGLSRGVFSVDMYSDQLLAVAGGDCAVRLFEIAEAAAETDVSDIVLTAVPAERAGGASPAVGAKTAATPAPAPAPASAPAPAAAPAAGRAAAAGAKRK